MRTYWKKRWGQEENKGNAVHKLCHQAESSPLHVFAGILRMIFMFLTVKRVKDYLPLSKNSCSILLFGPQSSKYLLSGPLEKKFAKLYSER